MKKVNVMLAFHAHEPLWDFPGELQKLAADPEIQHGIVGENYLRKRQQEGRDIYRDLLKLARDLEVTLCLEITNELLFQISKEAPETFKLLSDGFKENLLYPVLGHAHHTHVALLREDELEEEVRLNSDYLYSLMEIPRPKFQGVFPTEDSLDASKLSPYHRLELSYVIFPHLNPAKIDYTVTGEGDVKYFPFLIHDNLIALPRNFNISQRIWQPLTQLHPGRARNQGYLLGDYNVFDEEYRGKAKPKFPITLEEARNDYLKTVREEIQNAPDGALLLYIQDLELMDFGDDALDLMNWTWSQLKKEKLADLHFITPDDYLPDIDINTLPKVKFDQITWAPEIRPVLRIDGHYPPLYVDHDPEYQKSMKRWPFAFWEPGRFFAALANIIMETGGESILINYSAGDLQKLQYNPAEMKAPLRTSILCRLIKRACNWGWRPDEGRQKRPLLHLYLLCQHFLGKTEPVESITVSSSILSGLEALIEYFVDYRLAYLEHGFKELKKFTQEAENAFEAIRSDREKAIVAVKLLREKSESDGEQDIIPWFWLLSEVQEYCRVLFKATDRIQQLWSTVDDVPAMITSMYHYLYKQYPPKFLLKLNEIFDNKNIREDRITVDKKEYQEYLI